MKLDGKVALITGGTEGMGYSTAKLFLEEGARVVITGRSKEKAAKALKSLRKLGQVVFVQGDVSKASDARRMVETTVRAFGGINILFNNAGVYMEKLAEDTSEEEWDRVLDINLKGTFLVTKYAIPHMKRQRSGAIVNSSSDAGLVGNKNCPAYCASKGAITIMSKAMALDYAPYGIRVNTVNPGCIDTPMLAKEAMASGNPVKYMKQTRKDHPIGRVGTPEEVAHAVLFLVSDEAAFITGAALSIDGGLTAQ
ncbi:MAG: SDR family oxidoreductase [Candidatus Thermoplasmatota archaeon]|nr:SDR family oxidoreductase [Candidatus Thermoplasmatota archaeon]